jgi:hypothetical protein
MAGILQQSQLVIIGEPPSPLKRLLRRDSIRSSPCKL